MRRRILACQLACLLACSGGAAWAAGRPLHEEDAKRLEAFVLAENLLDFAARANSARAYLMAAELRLLYPVKEQEGQPGETIETLLSRGQALAPTDAAVQMWARQLSKLAEKSPRGEEAPLWRLDLHLEPAQKVRVSLPAQPGSEGLVMVTNPVPGLTLSLRREADGSVVESSTEAWLYFPQSQPLILEIMVLDGAAHDLTLLRR